MTIVDLEVDKCSHFTVGNVQYKNARRHRLLGFNLMEAIPLCDNIEVYIYLCLDTAY